MNQDNRGNSVFDIISLIITVLTGIPSFYSLLNNNKLFSIIFGLTSIFAFIATVVYLLVKRHLSLLYRFIIYIFTRKHGFVLKMRDLYYEYTDRKHIEHQKKFLITTKRDGFDSFTDRYVFSGDAVCKLNPTLPGQNIVDEHKDHGWYFYSIKLDAPVLRNRTVELGMKMNTIVDTNGTAQPYLSTGIYEATKKLNMEVHFGDNIIPQFPKLRVYKDYVDRFPIDEIELQFNYETHSINYSLLYPLYHYKYQIVWSFE